MALAKYGTGIIEITGSFAGQHFKRDLSGNHISAQPRIIKRRTTAQAAQRNAFQQARQFCNNYTCISINIYRILNGLPPEHIHTA